MLARLLLAAACSWAAGPASPWRAAPAGPAFEIPEVPPAVFVDLPSPLFSRELWEQLDPIEGETAVWLAARVPAVRKDRVRALTAVDADALLGRAVARRNASCDVFSDDGLRSDRVFFLDREVVRLVFAHYDLHMLNVAAGQTTDGQRYALEGLFMGGGRVVPIYNLPDFTFRNPDYPDHDIRFREPLTYTISGDCDFGVKNAWAKTFFGDAELQRLVRIDAQTLRVQTSMGNSDHALERIERKTAR